MLCCVVLCCVLVKSLPCRARDMLTPVTVLGDRPERVTRANWTAPTGGRWDGGEEEGGLMGGGGGRGVMVREG